MSPITQAMAILMGTFQKYAGKGKKTLTKAELAELLRVELLDGKAPTKAKVDDFFTKLDNDKNSVVDFKEYVTFVAAFTLQCDVELQ